MGYTYRSKKIEAVRVDTGEVIEVEASEEKKGRTLPFYKFFEKVDDVLLLLSEKNASVFVYIYRHMEQKTNILYATFEDIRKGANVSYKSVTRAMDTFEMCDFVRMKRRGEWMVNPYMVMKGDENKQHGLGAKYYAIDKD